MIHAVAPALLFALVTAAPVPAPAPPAAVEPNKAGSSSSSSVVDIDGVKRTMRGSRGRVLLVHFWATWCLPCLDELPIISKFASEMKPRGLDVLSLSLDKPDAAARVRKLLSEQAPNLTPVIVDVGDPDRFISAFDSRWEGTIPALFAYDPTGQLRGSHVGEASRNELDTLVGELLKGRAGDSGNRKTPGKKK